MVLRLKRLNGKDNLIIGFDILFFRIDSYEMLTIHSSLDYSLGLGGERAVEVPATTDQEKIVNNSIVIDILVHLLCREHEADPTRREYLFKGLFELILFM